MRDSLQCVSNRLREKMWCGGGTKVEHASQPLIVIIHQADICLDAHHTGVRQGGLCAVSTRFNGNEGEAILSR